MVFTARSSKNDYSIALNTVREHLREDAKVVNLDFPMTKDHAVMQTAWQENAEAVAAELRAGRNAVFLTIGDSLTYSTFGYLLKTLAEIEPEAQVEVIPGITAYHSGGRQNQAAPGGGQGIFIGRARREGYERSRPYGLLCGKYCYFKGIPQL